jgi:hypothetical protein
MLLYRLSGNVGQRKAVARPTGLPYVATNQRSMVNRRNNRRADIFHLNEYGHLPHSQKATGSFRSYSDATKSALMGCNGYICQKKSYQSDRLYGRIPSAD